MAGPPPNPAITSNLLSTHRALLDTLTSFLTVSTHHILFLRGIYPPVSFVSTRAYNYPVRQNRHPDVCTWINDAVAAVRDQLEKNTVEKVALCIFECDTNQVLERWTFDLHALPVVNKRDRDTPLSRPTTTTASTAASVPLSNLQQHNQSSETGQGMGTDDATLSRKINFTDLEATFRATLSRISTSAARLAPLPDGPTAPECSFTMTIQVKDRADRPVGRLEERERQWIAAESEVLATSGSSPSSKLNTTSRSGSSRKITTTTAPAKENEEDKTSPTPKTHPIRRLEAGELQLELWVEESAQKFAYPASAFSSFSSSASYQNVVRQRDAATRAAAMSYGAGTEKFDPVHGYDLEEPDINRKPGGGAGTDYQRG